MTMQFDVLKRRVKCVSNDGKEFDCTPEMLMALDSDLGDTARNANANPGVVFTVREHGKRRSMAAFVRMPA
jgi:hypothetical protein